MRGILKLFSVVQVNRGSGSDMHYNKPSLFKKVNLATYYSVKNDENLAGYRDTFIELNPAFKDCNIEYEYLIRVNG
jgi:hypothetical protein